MSQLYLLIDLDRCYGCKVCQTACKMEHGCPAGVQSCIEPCRVERIVESGELRCDFVPTVCQHCNDPECMNVCPAGAIYRDENGFVRVSRDECLGCGSCEAACSYGAVSVAEIAGKTYAYKCDLCAERRARGMEPACVQHCMGDAITLCDTQKLSESIRDRHSWSVGHTVYVSSVITNLNQTTLK